MTIVEFPIEQLLLFEGCKPLRHNTRKGEPIQRLPLRASTKNRILSITNVYSIHETWVLGRKKPLRDGDDGLLRR